MDKVVFVKESDAVVRGESLEYKITNYITKETSSQISLAVSQLNGESPQTMSTQSDRIYYFLEGKAKFIFSDHSISIKANSTIFIPKGIGYRMVGSFKAVLVNSPAFDIKTEIIQS